MAFIQPRQLLPGNHSTAMWRLINLLVSALVKVRRTKKYFRAIPVSGHLHRVHRWHQSCLHSLGLIGYLPGLVDVFGWPSLESGDEKNNDRFIVHGVSAIDLARMWQW